MPYALRTSRRYHPATPSDFGPFGLNLVFGDEFETGSSPSNNYRSYYGLSAAKNAGMASTFTADLSVNPDYRLDASQTQTAGITSASSTVAGGLLLVGATNTPCTLGGDAYSQTRGLVRTAASYLYGYFEASLKLPAGQGFWPAFWLWPPIPDDYGDNWYEIDILEAPSTGSTGVYHNVHWGSFNASNQSGPTFKSGNFSTGFHKFGCLWTPNAVRFYVDDVETVAAAYTTPANIPSVPLCALIDFQVGGAWPGPPDGSTPWPGSLQCQYLRIYQ